VTTTLNRLLNSTITLYVLMVPICFLVATMVAFFGLPYMHIPAGMVRVTQISLFVAAACMSCDFVFATSHASLAGLLRWDLINGVWIAILLVRAVLVLFFLNSGFGLVTLAFIQLTTILAGYLAEMVILRRLLPTFRLKWQMPRMLEMRPILEHGWHSFLLSVANRINYQVDSIVIALFLPISEVTFYVIGLRLVEYLRDLLNSTTVIVAPLVSSYEAVGETYRVATTLIRSTKYSLFVGFLGATGLLALGTDFIRLWMGARFAGPSGNVLTILAVSVLASGTQFASSQVLYGLSKHKINVNWTIAEAVLNLGFSLALVSRYGIVGVATGTALASIIVRGWLYPRSLLAALEVPWKEYSRDGVLPAVPPALCFLAGALGYKRYFAVQNYAGLIVAVICGLVPFMACVWLFGLDNQERGAIRSKAKHFVGHVFNT
jgi:O-antigen/teichoic acid export membrane protein